MDQSGSCCNSGVGRRSFLAAGLLAAGAVGFAGKKILWQHRATPQKVNRNTDAGLVIRQKPVETPPHGELADIVPVQETRELLLTLLPCWVQAIKVDNVLHAFRLWGPNAEFPKDTFVRPFEDRATLDGNAMEGILRDSSRFEQVFPHDPPLLVSFPEGTLSRLNYSPIEGSSIGALLHPNNLLAGFAELGYPADTSLVAVKGDKKFVSREDFAAEFIPATIRDMVRGSTAYFDLQEEQEWTVEALARYLAPHNRWVDRFGQSFSFDSSVRAILARPRGAGSCLGLHGPYALTCLWRIDQQTQILSSSVRREIEQYLQEYSRDFEENQNGLGLYPHISPQQWGHDPHENRSGWLDTPQLTYLSHSLEWIAFAPEPLRPRRDKVKRAVEAMLRGLAPWSMYVRSGDYGPLSHAGASLCGLLKRRATEIVASSQHGT